jgi:hypothetical protein
VVDGVLAGRFGASAPAAEVRFSAVSDVHAQQRAARRITNVLMVVIPQCSGLPRSEQMKSVHDAVQSIATINLRMNVAFSLFRSQINALS